ncbi:type I restriction-modification system subunit M N-terminal domain-containing protein [Roseovarius sp. E0-M6]|uniref:type I restriction-modification system subunit M N-terminal domain-containing protein n=1 Tax=Roseovarius sp. E0-M6 TaxID=3127118 RepID=UPI0030101D8A
MSGSDIKNLGSFVWSIAELLRGDFKQSEYGKVVLPFIGVQRLCFVGVVSDAQEWQPQANSTTSRAVV